MFSKISEIQKSGKPFALATIIKINGSSPRHLGAKMAVMSDCSIAGTIGGGKLEQIVIQDAISFLKDNQNGIKDYRLNQGEGGIGTVCGGDVSVFFETFQGLNNIVIFGAGHIGKALTSIATILGFNCVVLDDREEFLKDGLLPANCNLIKYSDNFEMSSLLNNSSYVVIVTYSHKMDKEILRKVLKCDVPYVGMIGSKTKVRTVFNELKNEGVNEKKLEQVCSPIGIDINAETPEEIAVSIMGEIIKYKNQDINKERNI